MRINDLLDESCVIPDMKKASLGSTIRTKKHPVSLMRITGSDHYKVKHIEKKTPIIFVLSAL